MLRLAVHLCIAGMVLGLTACAGTPERTPTAPADDRTAALFAPAFAPIVSSRRTSVVDITTLRIGRDEHYDGIEMDHAPANDFADGLAWPIATNVRLSEIRDIASGMILSSEGLILTSAHVVANIDEAQVRLHDGRRFNAHVVGLDSRSDVALLKIQAKDLPVAPIGDSSRLKPGDWVAAISAPFGFNGSVTAGVVSATDRFIFGAGQFHFIQTDVAINPGSSGSPLFNRQGEVVAMNSMIYSGSGGYMGLSFSIPINLVTKIVAQLRTHGTVRRAQLGAEVQEMTTPLARAFGIPEASGALVVRVDADSPAKDAGLMPGDVISTFDGVPVSSSTKLLQQIADFAPGTPSRMHIWRQGKLRTIRVTLAEQPVSKVPSLASDAVAWNDGLGLSLGELSRERRVQLHIENGLVVREVTGSARTEGIRTGDLLLALNDVSLNSVDDFRRTLSRIQPGRTVALLVMRNRRAVYVTVRIPEEAMSSTGQQYFTGPAALDQRFQVADEEQR